MEHSRTDVEELKSFLASRDAPCPGCGYNLRGLIADRCPECNEELRLQVGLVEPKLASFLAGLIGLACGAGFYWVVLAWACVMRLMRTWGPSPIELGVIIFFSLVLGAALWGWLRLRSRLRGMNPTARVALAALCWLFSAAAAAVFFTVVR